MGNKANSQAVEWVQLDLQVNESNEFFVPEDYQPTYLDELEKGENNG